MPKLFRIFKYIPGTQNRFFKKLILVFFILGLIAVIFLTIFVAEYKDFNDVIKAKVPKLSWLAESYNLLDVLYFYSYFQETKLPKYEIIIEEENLKVLNENLPDISEITLSEEYKKNSVPAILKYNGEDFEVKVRYRGDSQVHWAYPKKSWRVELTNKTMEDKGLINGMESFNLIIGGDRSLVTEQLSYYRSKKLGLAVPHSEFVDLEINGKYQGAYWLLETWDKTFLEKNKVASDINLYGENVERYEQKNIFASTDRWTKYTSDEMALFDNFAEVEQLLYLLEIPDEEFYEKISELVDLDSFYKWNTITLLVGGDGQKYSNNIRMYFDNTQGKFNFIPWDISQVERPELYDAYVSPIIDRILSNPRFLQERNNYLWDYVKNEENLEDDLKYYDELFGKVKISFHKDHLKLYSNLFFDRQVSNRRKLLIEQVENIKNKLSEAKVSVEARIDTDFNSSRRVVADLNFLTQNFNSLNIKKISFRWDEPGSFKLYDDTNNNGIWDDKDQLVGNFKRDNKWHEIDLNKEIFARRDYDDYKKFKQDKFYQENFFNPVNIIITPYRLFIVSQVPKFVPENFKFKIENSLTGKEADLTKRFIDLATFANFEDIFKNREQFILDNPIFKLNEEGIVLQTGIYQINKDIIIPKNTSLTIQVGTILNFASSTSMVSYSPVNISGTKNNPIIFTAQDKNRPWGVLGLTSGADGSIINYAIFEHGSDDYINGIYFSGMVSSYFAKTAIDNSTFQYAQADDGLNIKNSSSTISNSFFHRNSADGLDLDFSNSRVENNRFIGNGNDGLDLSSHQPFILNNYIEGSGDKGISIGEDSKAIIINNLMKDNKIGIEIKDLSEPQVINCTIIGNEIGINSYQKKAIFGGGHGKVYNSVIWANDEQITFDNKSTISINQTDVEGGYEGNGNLNLDPKFADDFKTQNSQMRINLDYLKQYLEILPKELFMGIY
ncbi:CotH kinase family protein [Patescibacteria group bacterium]|nr:CotH kinase family protein [Patescibacteria group bacterium]MBU4511792.1 CotH kinase family protein [Patescibacteria group bacterium]